jgi:basic amino acid/polyamine antiporter, APA family
VSSSALDRALGRRDLTLFAINRVIGAGIFGIPAVLYASVGPLSVLAFLLAALAISLITLCFAEVGSAHRDTGGPYLYAYRTFGPVIGFEVGWLMWVTQLGGFATVINLFVNYIGWFAPSAVSGLPRAAIVLAVATGLTIVNVLGVRRAATINNILTLGKLVPLALFVIVGAFFVDGSRFALEGTPTGTALSGAVLVAVYAFSGFEVLGVPSGEIDDPARTIPFALLAGLAVVAMIYVGVQVVAIGTLPSLATSARPLADAADQVFGRVGATVMVTGALVSTLGVSHAILLAAGRMPFAMAERRQLPASIAAVHPVYRTPWIGLIVSAVCMLLFTLATTFTSALTITVGLRVIIYLVTCATLPVLRRRPGEERAAFRVPAGNLVAVSAVLTCIGLLAMRPWTETRQLIIVLVLGLLVWAGCGAAVRRNVPDTGERPGSAS